MDMASYEFVWFQHTAARRRLDSDGEIIAAEAMFQHTAARRRLDKDNQLFMLELTVSTHSRPKAAGFQR